MSKEYEKQLEATIVKMMIKECLKEMGESKDNDIVDNYVAFRSYKQIESNEALEAFDRILHCKDDDYTLGYYNHDITIVKQALQTDIPIGRGYGKNIAYLKECLEKMNDKPIFYMSRSYGNKYIVPEEYFNNLTTERDTYKRVLNVIKEKRIDTPYLCELYDSLKQGKDTIESALRQYNDSVKNGINQYSLTEEDLNLLIDHYF